MGTVQTMVGAQVSSLKPYLQTPESLRDSLWKLAEMGYRLVQMQWWNPDFTPEFVAQAVRDAGLQCVSTQDYYTAVKADFDRTVRLNELCGSRCICVSGIPADTLNRESVLTFAEELSKMAAQLAPLGMTLAFHPRAREWAVLAEENTTCTELLLQNTPENVTLGLDLYHSNKAGLAPDALLHCWAGRVSFVHFKDYRLGADGAEHLTPLGQGRTDWQSAVRACQETNVPWAFAEQETWEKDAFVCMRESLDTMRGWGFMCLEKRDDAAPHPKLVLLRGNSGSGKTSVAKALQEKFGPNTMRISSDMVRMEMLHVWGAEGIAKSEPLMVNLLKYGREHSPITILEGVLPAEAYHTLFKTAVEEYGQNIFAYYYDLSFEETLRRHSTKPNRNDFGEEAMRRWWKEKDFLPMLSEKVLHQDMSLKDTIEMIYKEVIFEIK